MSGLIEELRRRNVIRVAGFYLVAAWLIVQVAETVLPAFDVPGWVLRTIIIVLAIGFIPAAVFAWVYELTPEGLKRESEIDRSQSRIDPTARKLDIAVIVLLLAVAAVTVWRPATEKGPEAFSRAESPGVAPSPDGENASGPFSPPDALQPPPGSLAVLPFTNRSAEPDTAYFVDGIHDDLLTELSRNAALTVISRTSMMEYRDTTKNLRQIGEELGVAHVLEGAVQRAGQRVRINAQLIDARSDKHLWAETFDRELKPESIFEIQSEIAGAIAAALSRKLGLANLAALPGNLPTRSAKAYDDYLRARITRETWTEKAIRARIALYQQAIEADPQFALAMGELGREHANMYWFITRRDEDREASRRWIEQALALQPDAPQLRLAKAEYHYRAHLDYDRALDELAIAERGLPGSADVAVLRAYIQRRAGRPAETMAALEQAVKFDPRSMSVLTTLAETSALLGDLDAADAWTQKLEQLPDVPMGSGVLTTAVYRLQLTGDQTAAVAEFERLRPRLEQDWEASVANLGLQIHRLLHDQDSLQAAIERMPKEMLEDQFYLRPKSLLRAQVAGLRQQPEQVRRHAAMAVQEAEAVLRSHPEDYRAWMLKALGQAMLDQEDAARDAVREAFATPIPTRDVVLRAELQVEQMQVLALLGDVEGLAQAIQDYHAQPMKYWGFKGLIRLPELHRHRTHPAIQALARKYPQKDGAP